MSRVSVRKRPRSPITTDFDDAPLDSIHTLLMAGEGGFEIQELGQNREIKLEFDSGQGWKPLRRIVGNEVAYFPPGTFIRPIGGLKSPDEAALRSAEELRRA